MMPVAPPFVALMSFPLAALRQRIYLAFDPIKRLDYGIGAFLDASNPLRICGICALDRGDDILQLGHCDLAVVDRILDRVERYRDGDDQDDDLHNASHSRHSDL